MTGAEKMINDKFVAISSNESAIHATNKDPKIITVVWFIGKRCNFDCSYCPSIIHDNHSPHIDHEKAFFFLDELQNHCEKIGKRFKISFTGGEPFVHPKFIDILEYAKSKKNAYHIGVTTNGSVALIKYLDASEFLDSVSISLHLEQPEQNLFQTVDKAIELDKNKKIFLVVNIMALPGKFGLVKELVSKLKNSKVKHVVKRIDPPRDEYEKLYQKSDKSSKILNEPSIDNFIEYKVEFMEKSRLYLDELYKKYYAEHEIEFLKQYENSEWHNIKLHYSDGGTFLTNTEELKIQDVNGWKGWSCYIGIDNLYLQHDGSVFKGNCMQDGKIGKIGEHIDFPNEPVICAIKKCLCSSDMCARKYKTKQDKFLIS